ncbi:MAG TPA: S53 family peptidase [Kofleriaceae bacterium]|nr:S53 family peptidase [Kofleriaceae bacterium]
MQDQQVDDDGTVQQPTTGVCTGGHFQCRSQVRTDEHNRIKPFATPSGLGPNDLASAYKLNATKTSTATIAIVDAFNYPNAASDLASYRSQFGLPACTVASGCLTIDNAQGAGNAPAGDDWTVEAALDLDLASAACPTCKLLLVEAKDDQGTGLFTAQHQAAAHAGVVAISNSWGGPSDGMDLSEDSTYFTIAGVNIFVASGDGGNTGSTADYPSTSAHVVSVGGTHLAKATGTTRGWTETAWAGSGSSCSSVIPKPPYQTPAVPPAACTKRATVDVSAVADPNTGLAVFNAANGGWIVVGGTSAASPFVAGVFARYGLPKTNDASYPYGHTSEFFDITSGSNGSCNSALCKVGVGWDGPTGIGSPNGANLGGVTTCAPNCSGKTCGSDGCGGICGVCAAGQTCSATGTCTGGTTCAHPICSTGTKLVATCDPCTGEICSADSFCCASSWDSICVGEVGSVCGQSCP